MNLSPQRNILLQIVDQIYTTKQEIKKSNFISYLCPFAEFKSLHESLKQAHPKAVHIVWAYRYYNKYGQITENQSDDGEPKGTSGIPTLNALRGAELINSAIFIVRYFGGIKLGTGGLVRAYSSSANLVINEALLVKFEIKDSCIMFVSFALLARFEHFLDKEKLDTNKNFNTGGSFITLKCNKDEFMRLYDFATAFENDGFYFLALPLFTREILVL